MSEYNLKYLCYLDFPGTFDFKAIFSNDQVFCIPKKVALFLGFHTKICFGSVKNDLAKSSYRNHTVDGRNPAPVDR